MNIEKNLWKNKEKIKNIHKNITNNKEEIKLNITDVKIRKIYKYIKKKKKIRYYKRIYNKRNT